MKRLLSLLTLFAFITTAGMANVPAKINFRKTSVSINQIAAQNQDTSSTKKDGSPDKRFKANRKQKPVVIPLKKDGTPDGRFKVTKNKKDSLKS